MANITALKAELTDDPLVRGYAAMSDQAAADDLNTVNRDADGGVAGIANYLVKNRSRLNTGTDLVATSLIGRLQEVEKTTVGQKAFGTTSEDITTEHVHAARMVLFLANSPHIDTFDFVNAEVSAMLDILGGGAGNARVWKAADITAIKALSQNQQSRAMELNLGRVLAGTVAEARA